MGCYYFFLKKERCNFFFLMILYIFCYIIRYRILLFIKTITSLIKNNHYFKK